MKTLQELAQEVNRRNGAKIDVVADTRKLHWTDDGKVQFTSPKRGLMTLAPTEHFRNQVAERLGIYRDYFDRMFRTAPHLLATNINHWFQNEPEPRLVRILDEHARAFLSQRYRTLDDFDMLQAVLPPLMEHKVTFHSCEVTERRMYIKALFPKVQAEVKPGDIVQAGVVISNSEVGAGSFKVEPFTYRLVCSNGMISEHVLSKYHVGRGRGGDEENIYEILSNAAKSADDKALFLKVRDVVLHSLTDEAFQASVEKFREAATVKISADVPEVVERTRRQFGFTKEQGKNILQHLIEGADLSKWGLANAVTRTAQDQEDYDEQTSFERAGGKVIELQQKDWKYIAGTN